MADRILEIIHGIRSVFKTTELSVLELPENSRDGIKPNFLYGVYCNPPSTKYHKGRIDIDVYKFLLYLQKEEVIQHIKENNGKLKWTIKQAKPQANKPERWYGSLDSNEWKKQKELTSKEHSPDRAITSKASEDDLPF